MQSCMVVLDPSPVLPDPSPVLLRMLGAPGPPVPSGQAVAVPGAATQGHKALRQARNFRAWRWDEGEMQPLGVPPSLGEAGARRAAALRDLLPTQSCLHRHRWG